MNRQSILVPGLLITRAASGPASADWEKFGETRNGAIQYVDPGSVQRTGQLVKLSFMIDHRKTITDSGRKSRSWVWEKEYDCQKRRHRYLRVAHYSENMRHCPAAHNARDNETRGTTMQYLLMIYSDEKGMAAMSEADAGKMMAAYGAYSEALQKAGAILGGNRLKPTETATSVRVSGGKSQVLNGPYAETKEQLGGYFVIEAADLDAAISWAARCPGASHGTVEVRPIWPM